MKKIFLLMLIGIILSGCSGLPDLAGLLTTPTLPPPPDTPTPKPTVTAVPTYDYFAVQTPTPVTFTPTGDTSSSGLPEVLLPPPTLTLIPLPTFSEQFINDMSSTTFFNQTVGFTGVLYSAATLYWGSGACTTRSIKFTAFVDDPARTDRVFLFLRLHDKTDTLKVGEWSAGAEMIKIENGSFNYNVDTDNLRRYWTYKQAWLEYELVAVNENLEILGRTQLYDRNISLVKCGL
jgi:hypothetical protein